MATLFEVLYAFLSLLSLSPLLKYDQWVWNDVVGTMCSEGTQTGYALNVHQGSTDLVVVFAEGGICHDYASCYQQHLAVNIGTPFDEATFVNQSTPSRLSATAIMTRLSTENPFHAANYAWPPYCTGDLHAGNSSVVYAPMQQPTHHHGYANSEAVLKAVQLALPDTKRVWVAGSSAGGFGAILQYQQAQAIFGSNVRVDMVADSAEAQGDRIFYPSLGMVLPSQSGCPECDSSDFNSFLPALADANPGSRFAALSFASDNVLPTTYESIDQATMDAEISQLFGQINVKPNAKTFVVPGSGHGALSQPFTPAKNGLTMATFLQDMTSDSPNWSAGL